MWRNQNPYKPLMRMENGVVTLENSLIIPQKLNMEQFHF